MKEEIKNELLKDLGFTDVSKEQISFWLESMMEKLINRGWHK